MPAKIGQCADRPPGTPVSRIAQAYPDRVEVRGRDLTGDLMGRLGFTEYFHLLLTGSEPTDEQRFFLDLLLVSIAEHGMMPTNVAARMTLAADPDSLQGAVAGILAAGLVVLGHRRGVRAAARGRAAAGGGGRRRGAVAEDVARRIQAGGGRCPGSGIRCTGRSTRGPSGSSSSRTSAASQAPTCSSRVASRTGSPTPGEALTMNVSLPIAAVLLDLGFPSSTVKAIPILARTAGLPRTSPRSSGSRSAS